ncbi:MAG: ABC transporter ATP-binding protein [Brooklawnia sp.]|jgi:ABC-type nitrate/sulfonate/bicarbonate transport system ATPase subunit
MTSSRERVLLSAEGLSRSFDDEEILADVSLAVAGGEIVSILGLSGSGKTTLFNLLAGLDEPEQGTVVAEAKIGYMLQKDLLLPWKRVGDNIALPLTLAGTPRAEARVRVRAELGRFGLSGLGGRWPFQLSGGERQRAALLRTWLYGGQVLLLDEPFSGLDAITREDLQGWLKHLIDELGLTVLLITHDVDEALALSDRLYVLSAGRPATLHDPIELDGASDPVQHEQLRSRVRQLLYTDAAGRDVRRKGPR